MKMGQRESLSAVTGNSGQCFGEYWPVVLTFIERAGSMPMLMWAYLKI